MPDAGAVLDQDYALIERMTALNGVFVAVVRWRSLKGKHIHELTPSEGRILEFLRLEGINFND